MGEDIIDLDLWPRGVEVRNYAIHHGISAEEAVQRLVNSGLSHEERSWL